MGLIRDLIAGYAASRAQEHKDKAERYNRMGDLYKYIIDDPKSAPEKKAMAVSGLVDLLQTQAGKKGREAVPHVLQLIHTQDQVRSRMQNLAGTQPGTQGTQQGPGASAPSDLSNVFGLESRQPPQGQPAPPQDGKIAGWRVDGGTPQGPGQQQPSEPPYAREGLPLGTGGRAGVMRSGAQPQKPSPFRPVLRTLAGIGRGAESVGRGITRIGRDGMPEPPPFPEGLRGGWEMTDQEQQDQWFKEGQARGLKGDVLTHYGMTGKLPARFGEDLSNIRADATLLMRNGTRIPARETKQGNYETLAGDPIDPGEIRDVLPKGQVEPRLTGRLKTRDDATRMAQSTNPAEAAEGQAELDYLNNQDKSAKSRALVAERQSRAAGDIVPGSEEFQVAQDLAYGDLTYSQFLGMYRYSRDQDSRLSIYKKARELNPGFNAADFEAGYKLASSPKVRQQLGSLDNAEAGINDLISLSDQAIRTGSPAINKLVLPGGYYIAGGPYSSFDVGTKLFADELSGGLGFGSATDMKLRLGLDVTDGNVSPQDFKNNMEIIKRFIERKRKYTLGQAGPYSQRGAERDPRLPQRPREFDQLISIDDAKKYMQVYGDKDKAMEAAENDGWRVSQK